MRADVLCAFDAMDACSVIYSDSDAAKQCIAGATDAHLVALRSSNDWRRLAFGQHPYIVGHRLAYQCALLPMERTLLLAPHYRHDFLW